MALRDPKTHPSVWPSFELAQATGGMELGVSETTTSSLTRPEKVSAILAHCLARIDGLDATLEVVRSLSVGTREWLLQQVAAQCRPAQDWHEVQCPACANRFDISFDLADLPRAGVPDGFPVVRVETDQSAFDLAVPNGATEEKLARHPAMPTLEFLQDCAVTPETATQLVVLSSEELDEIDNALDEATPEPADTIGSTCPDCGSEVTARIEPLSYAFPAPMRVLQDVHRLSSAYHWSEAEVLAMPTQRRLTYVKMVSAATGAA